MNAAFLFLFHWARFEKFVEQYWFKLNNRVIRVTLLRLKKKRDNSWIECFLKWCIESRVVWDCNSNCTRWGTRKGEYFRRDRYCKSTAKEWWKELSNESEKEYKTVVLKSLIFERLLKTCHYNERWKGILIHLTKFVMVFVQDSTIEIAIDYSEKLNELV